MPEVPTRLTDHERSTEKTGIDGSGDVSDRTAALVVGVVAAGLLVLAAVGGPPSQPSQVTTADDENATITLNADRCYGTCPAYTIKICGDGTVHYRGLAYAEVMGYERFEISEQRVSDLVETASRTAFFRLRDRYTAQVTDLPSTTVSVTIDGRSASVYEYGNAGPQRLDRFQREIERVVGDRIDHAPNHDPPDDRKKVDMSCRGS